MTKRKASVALDTGNESNQSTSTQDNNSNSTSTTNATTVIVNNNNTRNGTATADGSNRSSAEDNGGPQNKCKKERADNWSSAEIQILHRGIESRRDIFYGPPSQATKKNRELAWDAITKEVNSVSTTPRSLSQVMKKYKNEKCRAKRKFTTSDKDGHNDNNVIGLSGLNSAINTSSNNNSNNSNNNNSNSVGSTNNGNTNLGPPNQTNSNPGCNNNSAIVGTASNAHQLQSHHMTATTDSMSQSSSINVVKLAPHNVAKTMIDLPGHVQQIQMPNDDMVLIVPNDMDGLLSSVNIVAEGNVGKHFQTQYPAGGSLNNQNHNNHGHHTIQAINTGPSILNGTMSNGMVTRALPPGSMCSLVYSTSGEVCANDHHVTGSVSGPTTISSNHISVNAQSLMHHRGPIDHVQTHQGNGQSNQHHQLSHAHQQQLHQQQQQQQQQHQSHQQQQQQQHQPTQLQQQTQTQVSHAQPHQTTAASHHLQQHQQQQQQQQQTNQQQQHQHQHHQHQQQQQQQQQHQQTHIPSSSTVASACGGVAVDSQLKNLLLKMLLKDGEQTMLSVNSSPDYNKPLIDMLAIIANSLKQVENHLGTLAKAAGVFLAQNTNGPSTMANSMSIVTQQQTSHVSSVGPNNINNNGCLPVGVNAGNSTGNADAH